MSAKLRPQSSTTPSAIPRAPSRVIIEGVAPAIDFGAFPIKRTPGEEVAVEADVFADGHEVIRAVVLHRAVGVARWSEEPMSPLVNDRWGGRFGVGGIGRHEYTIAAWIDAFASWRRDLGKK